ncbi:MAG: cysteine desulfurase family protein [Geothrix sp.]|uniref:cysteine desulfurase family protein n=1 Tax=Geothrix sp. TaxID=1962974 RepID=UPI003BB0F6D3
MTTNPDPIYLDHNATTPLLPEVLEAMLPFLSTHFGNASSSHIYGQRTREAIMRARAQVATLIGATPEEIVFTSGGIEANNLAIRGVAQAATGDRHIVTSVIEHPATDGPCTFLEAEGWRITRLGVDVDGRVRPGEADAALSAGTALMTLMHANNETGVLQPVAELARLARARGILVHTDAAQSVGKVPVHVDDLGVDLLSLVGHKVYAPKGIGVLYVRKGTPLQPLLLGSPGDLRSGTLNTPSIVALGAACEIAARDLAAESARLLRMRDELWDRLHAAIPGLRLHGHPSQRLPNTLNVGFPGVTGGALLGQAKEIAASTGAACHAGQNHGSAVLLAMGLTNDQALGAVRLSLGKLVGEHQIADIAESLSLAWELAR